MNDGVALLLERMKTNPEEFFDFGSKWAGVIGEHKDFLEAEDRQALTDGLNKLMQQRFTEKVLEELVDPKKSSLEELLIAKRNATPSAGQTPVPSTITLSRKEQINAMKVEVRKKATLKKEHKTIFGRLFNYQ